ncbi:Protein OS-9 [Collariella sp. IMI 366227]|nr:Protein OS-9 [Collariella sp. IMI 366227]
MRRLNLVLLASLQLCRARQPGFSIHDDLLAHPQFEVVFSDDFISEPDALALLQSSSAHHPAYSADPSQSDLASKVRESTVADPQTGSHDGNHDTEDDEDAPISETYELINNAPWRYLCSVPVLAPPTTLNKTATELAKAEEARELSRASAKGWELLRGLHGTCMFFTSGWWSYSYCYDEGVVQFHAQPTSLNKLNSPPVRDENSQEYILGRVQEPWDSQHPTTDGDGSQTTSLAPPHSQLQVKGDQRYLSQHLEGGTICDLTGRPRTIEIQYHCAPGTSTDRIGWIKEMTTCTYLMLVHTPRLCDDMAFQPPKPIRAHPIRCRQIIASEDEESAWRYHKRVEAGERLGSSQRPPNPTPRTHPRQHQLNHFTGLTIGGITIGGTHPDGKPKQARNPGISPTYPSHQEKGATKVERMSDAEMKKLNLDPKEVDEFQRKMERLAGACVYLGNIAPIVPILTAASTAFKRLMNDIEAPSTIDGTSEEGRTLPADTPGQITLTNVPFAYPFRSNQPVLRNVNLSFPAGNHTRLSAPLRLQASSDTFGEEDFLAWALFLQRERGQESLVDQFPWGWRTSDGEETTQRFSLAAAGLELSRTRIETISTALKALNAWTKSLAPEPDSFIELLNIITQRPETPVKNLLNPLPRDLDQIWRWNADLPGPCNPDKPKARLKVMVEQTGARLLIASSTQSSLAQNLILLSGEVITTKGVVVSHANFTSGTIPRAAAVGYAYTFRVFEFASYAFDVSIDCMLCTLAVGGTICIPSTRTA